MNRLAREHQAVDLAQGSPDFPSPDGIRDAAVRALLSDRNQYTESAGLEALRCAVARTYEATYGLAVSENEVTVTNGATEALFIAIVALLGPGDEVIVFAPAYESYGAAIAMAGAAARYVRLYPPAENGAWQFDERELAGAFNARTRALILNNPHNPTGKVFSRGELAHIAECCAGHDVIVIADEVYERIVFHGSHVPMATLPEMMERTITVNSAGKVFGVTGWRVGYAIGSAELSEAIRLVHQDATFAAPTPLQHAVADALQAALSNGYYERLREFYGEKRDCLLRVLGECGLDPIEPDGTYFLLSRFARWSAAHDSEFCRDLISSVGVAAIPLAAFYPRRDEGPPMIRFCFAKQTSTLEAAGERLQHGWSRLGRR